MKVTYRIPTKEQYAYIEVEQELQSLDSFLIRENYKELTRSINEPVGAGVGIKNLARILAEYCKTGSIVNGHEYEFSANEAALINEVKKTLRKSN